MTGPGVCSPDAERCQKAGRIVRADFVRFPCSAAPGLGRLSSAPVRATNSACVLARARVRNRTRARELLAYTIGCAQSANNKTAKNCHVWRQTTAHGAGAGAPHDWIPRRACISQTMPSTMRSRARARACVGILFMQKSRTPRESFKCMRHAYMFVVGCKGVDFFCDANRMRILCDRCVRFVRDATHVRCVRADNVSFFLSHVVEPVCLCVRVCRSISLVNAEKYTRHA